MCDLDTTGAPSIFKIIRSAAALARIFPILDLNCEENTSLFNESLSLSHQSFVVVVYYESIKRELKTKPMYECRCDERLKARVEESTRLGDTRLVGELEHLKTETRLL